MPRRRTNPSGFRDDFADNYKLTLEEEKIKEKILATEGRELNENGKEIRPIRDLKKIVRDVEFEEDGDKVRIVRKYIRGFTPDEERPEIRKDITTKFLTDKDGINILSNILNKPRIIEYTDGTSKKLENVPCKEPLSFYITCDKKEKYTEFIKTLKNEYKDAHVGIITIDELNKKKSKEELLKTVPHTVDHLRIIGTLKDVKDAYNKVNSVFNRDDDDSSGLVKIGLNTNYDNFCNDSVRLYLNSK